MTTYFVTTVSENQRAMADLDPNYSPAETIITAITCEEYEIDDLLAAGIKSGDLPADAMYTDAELSELVLEDA